MQLLASLDLQNRNNVARKTSQLRDEAPSAHKDIRAVLKAQKELVKVTRTLSPIRNYKGT